MRTSTKIARPRGRPREFDADEVLDRARVVFMDKGFSATSLDDLAAATGLNRPSLYAAFGDKEQLYLRALRRYAELALTMMDGIFARKGSIAQRLTQVFDTAIAQYLAPPRPPGCMIIGTAVVEAPTRPAIAAAASELLAAIEKSFESAFIAAVAAGELPAEPAAKSRARLAGATLDTLAIRARIGTRASELRHFARSAVTTICGGMSTL